MTIFVEPTSEKIYKLLQECKYQHMNRYETSLHISGKLVDNEDVVHMKYMDLVGLILNIARDFED